MAILTQSEVSEINALLLWLGASAPKQLEVEIRLTDVNGEFAGRIWRTSPDNYHYDTTDPDE